MIKNKNITYFCAILFFSTFNSFAKAEYTQETQICKSEIDELEKSAQSKDKAIREVKCWSLRFARPIINESNGFKIGDEVIIDLSKTFSNNYGEINYPLYLIDKIAAIDTEGNITIDGLSPDGTFATQSSEFNWYRMNEVKKTVSSYNNFQVGETVGAQDKYSNTIHHLKIMKIIENGFFLLSDGKFYQEDSKSFIFTR